MARVRVSGPVLIVAILAVMLIFVSGNTKSEMYQISSTKMNVTVRGYVAITASTCLTGGITFSTIDPGSYGNNATCNINGSGTGTGYNITVDLSSNTNVNFTQATNGSLLSSSYEIGAGNITYNSNLTGNAEANLLSNATATSLQATSFAAMEECDNVNEGSTCHVAYFLNVPDSNQPPGNYETKYCWCGRQINQAVALCGTCT